MVGSLGSSFARMHERRKLLIQIRTFKTISPIYEINLSFFLCTHLPTHPSMNAAIRCIKVYWPGVRAGYSVGPSAGG